MSYYSLDFSPFYHRTEDILIESLALFWLTVVAWTVVLVLIRRRGRI